MPEPQICVKNLTKIYRVPVRPEGLSASLKSLLNARRFGPFRVRRGLIGHARRSLGSLFAGWQS